jgi:hypothetical protein
MGIQFRATVARAGGVVDAGDYEIWLALAGQ